MDLEIYNNSKNYTCQVIKLPQKNKVEGLDNLVSISYQGNQCLISKDSPEDCLYLFFPAECQISHEFLSANNLYRHSELNLDKTKKGFFEDNRRCKAIKFKGIISTGFVIPIDSLDYLHLQGKIIVPNIKIGSEFNELDGIKICEKYIRPKRFSTNDPKEKKVRIIDQIVDSKLAPEHFDTQHLLKHAFKLNLNDTIAVTYKLHGTSARYYNTLVKRKLSLIERLCKLFGGKVLEEDYDYVTASRRVIKGVGFETMPNKNHYYESGDLWSEVGKEFFEGKLNKGEAVYCEIIGKTYSGEAIQSGYTYGFERPKVYIYRISNINPQGIEVDLSYEQMKSRAKELDIEVCPEFYYGRLENFLMHGGISDNIEERLSRIFYNQLLEKPSILDKSVVEEGFCLRIEKYPKPEIYKIKAKSFLLHEGAQLDKEVKNIEEDQIF